MAQLSVNPSCGGTSSFGGGTWTEAWNGSGGVGESVGTTTVYVGQDYTLPNRYAQNGCLRFDLSALTTNMKIKSAYISLTVANNNDLHASSLKQIAAYRHNFGWSSCPLTTGVTNPTNALGGVDEAYSGYVSTSGLGALDPVNITLNATAIGHIQDIALGGAFDDFLEVIIGHRNNEDEVDIGANDSRVLFYGPTGAYQPALHVQYESGNGMAFAHNF
jgi:hypothetical protein